MIILSIRAYSYSSKNSSHLGHNYKKLMDLSNLLSGTLSANANERVVSELELERLQTDPRMLSS